MTYAIGIWTLFLLMPLLLSLETGRRVILDGDSPLFGKLIAGLLCWVLGPALLVGVWLVPLHY